MSFFDTFKRGLQKTAVAIGRSVAGLFIDIKKWDDKTCAELENALLEADFGPETASKIVKDLRDRYDQGKLSGADDLLQIAVQDIVKVFDGTRTGPIFAPEGKLTVILMVGVNGSGKTTTAGKMAALWTAQGKKVTLAACDTFRAAAVEQLKLWAEKTGSQIVSSKQGADPSSVAFDAVKSAQAHHSDILIIDTAGRQHNKKGLMDELVKLRRTVAKLEPGAPQETLLTVDASVGLNAVAQAKEFSEAAGVTSIALTKLDGTGKGGSVVRIVSELHVPVLFIGLGEQPDDLQPFNAENYANAIFTREQPA